MDYHNDNDANVWAYRADAQYTFDNSSWLDKLRFGVRYEDLNRPRARRTTTGAPSASPGAAERGNRSGFPERLSVFPRHVPQLVPRRSGADRYPFVQSVALHDFGNFVNLYHQVCTPGNVLDPAAGHRSMATTARKAQVPAHWESTRKPRRPTPSTSSFLSNMISSTATWVFESFTPRAQGTAFLKFSPFSGNIAAVRPEDSGVCQWGLVSADGRVSYTDVLPSFNLRYKATDKVYLRFAVDKGI